MVKLQQIQEQTMQLPRAEQEALFDWLANMLEEELEFTDEFKEKITKGEEDIREGRVRVRKP
jgi:hypothetical protein